jgi:flagellar basal-body rod protein FlgG
MNRGIYSVVNGMLASQQALDTVSNNLANTNTTGFKADQVLFNEQLEKQLALGDNRNIGTLGSGPVEKSRFTNFEQGSLSTTGNSLDFALEGNGMFAVQGENGQVEYTRNGAFTQDAEGNLITKDGKAVLGQDQNPIQLKPGPISVTASGQIATSDGKGSYASIGMFQGTFTKTPDGLYESADATAVTAGTDSRGPLQVKQGALEASNVNSISSMVQMISLQRSFDMAQKSVWAEDDMTSKLNSILS